MIKTEGSGYTARVPVKFIPRDGQREIAILSDGQVVLYADPSCRINDLNNKLKRDIDNFLSPLQSDTYVRVHDKKADYTYLVNGTHKGSINHAKDYTECGLSVAKSAEYVAKYYYYVQGTEICKGSDGEPVLDINTVKVISTQMTAKQFCKDFYTKQDTRVKELGLTEVEVRLLKACAWVVE